MSVLPSEPRMGRNGQSPEDDERGAFGLSRNLAARIGSSVVILPPTVGLLYLGDPWLGILVAVVAARATWEWARLVTRRPESNWGTPSGLVTGAAVVVAALGWHGLALAAASFGAFLFVAAWAVRRLPRGAWLALGVMLVSAAGISLLYVRAGAPLGFESALWLVAVVIASDVGAYAAGRSIGGAKVAPRVSPNKTWSGCAGGLLAAMAVGAALALLFDVAPILAVVLLGGGLSIVAQFGDLGESALKRRFEVKDSGSLIPGHGGLLDRIDGHMAVMPVAAALTVWFGHSLLSF